MDKLQQRRFSRFLIYICLSLMMVVTAMALGGCADSYDKQVQMVRNGTMDLNPKVPVGPAFDQFFTNGKWESFEAEDKSQVVEFNGKCTWEDEPAKAIIQFILHNNKSFELGHVGINGVSLNRFASLAVVGKVLDSYQPKK